MCVKDAGNKSSSMFVGRRRYKVAPYRGLWLVDDWIIIVHNKLVREALFNKLSKNIKCYLIGSILSKYIKCNSLSAKIP